MTLKFTGYATFQNQYKYIVDRSPQFEKTFKT